MLFTFCLTTYTFQLKLELKFVEDVGLDSLDLVEFVMVLEDHFEIEVTFSTVTIDFKFYFPFDEYHTNFLVISPPLDFH